LTESLKHKKIGVFQETQKKLSSFSCDTKNFLHRSYLFTTMLSNKTLSSLPSEPSPESLQ